MTNEEKHGNFFEKLAMKESSGNYSEVNKKYNFLGKYQMGESALDVAGYYRNTDKSIKNKWDEEWTGKDGVHSKEDFLANHQAQENAVRLYSKKVWEEQLKEYHHLVGKTIHYINPNTKKAEQVTLTQSGMIGGAHLVGHLGLKKFIDSAGDNVPMDGTEKSKHRTPITSYIRDLGGYDVPTKNIPPSSPKAPTTPAAPPPLPITVKVPGSGGGTHTSQKPPSSVMHFSADHYKPFSPPPKPHESSGWQYTVKVDISGFIIGLTAAILDALFQPQETLKGHVRAGDPASPYGRAFLLQKKALIWN
jgi:hypothetical protein